MRGHFAGASVGVSGGYGTFLNAPSGADEPRAWNAGLTVGGTGDALAGLTAGLIAQRMDPAEAAMLASRTIKRAGALLFEQQGYRYTTREVIELMPFVLRELQEA